ncbi:MAG: OmpA family protein [Saprospiraceae bacterium]|nr:OmpA family protein [Saprospiraceae bacterium]
MTRTNIFKKLALVTVAFSFCLGTSFAQDAPDTNGDGAKAKETDPQFVRKSDQAKHADWQDGKELFPGRPRDMWQLGIGGGSFLVSGDVKSQFGWGASVHARKSFGYVFSLQGEYMFGQARGLNYQASSSGAFPSVAPFTGANAAYNIDDVFYSNYFMSQFHAVSLQTVYNLNNLKFHKKENKWALNVHLGLGGHIYQANYDALDANGNAYNFSSVATGLDVDVPADRRAIRNNIKNLLDGNYETSTEQNTRNEIILGRNSAKPLAFRPFVNVGLSLEFLVTKRLSIAIEHQSFISGDDFLDGKSKKENGSLTSNIDIPHYTSLRLNFHLGNKNKRIRPLWFVNPLIYPMQGIADVKDDLNGDLFQDDDKDGVINALDEEPDTPPDTQVDTKGRTLDSDSDGVPDRDDLEPYSPPGYETNEQGVAQVPPPITEETLAEIGEPIFEAKGNCCDGKEGGGNLKDWYLPMIHFDLDKYYLRPEAYSQLQHVAAVMKAYPDIKVVAYGHTDTRASNEYNQMLSYNRAMTAIDFLNNTYGIEKGRFIVRYDGESKNLIPNTSKEQEHFINRRVEFYVAGDNEKTMARPKDDGGKNRKWKY